jgi:hypothetical protein
MEELKRGLDRLLDDWGQAIERADTLAGRST